MPPPLHFEVRLRSVARLDDGDARRSAGAGTVLADTRNPDFAIADHDAFGIDEEVAVILCRDSLHLWDVVTRRLGELDGVLASEVGVVMRAYKRCGIVRAGARSRDARHPPPGALMGA